MPTPNETTVLAYVHDIMSEHLPVVANVIQDVTRQEGKLADYLCHALGEPTIAVEKLAALESAMKTVVEVLPDVWWARDIVRY